MISSVSSSLSLSLGQDPFILNSAFARLADIGASRGSIVYTTVSHYRGLRVTDVCS